MYDRMKVMGMGIWRHLSTGLALAVLVAIPASAIEERIVVSPGKAAVREAEPGVTVVAKDVAPTFGDWVADGAILRDGFRGAPEYVLAPKMYSPDAETDLLLPFEEGQMADSAGHWTVGKGQASMLDKDRAILGKGAAAFTGPDSTLSLAPGPKSILFGASRFRDFSIEFWLYPTNAENGEVVMMWQTLRKAGNSTLPQQLSCIVSSGRLSWSLHGFFVPPESFSPGLDPFPKVTDFQLTARGPLLPRTWSHHLLRFDGDTGLLEYLVDGIPEAMVYVTSSGHEGGTVFEPVIGASSPLKIGPDFSGLIDELRIERAFVTSPSLRPYGRDPALVVTPIVDLGYSHSRLLAVDIEAKRPGTTDIDLSYRLSDEAAAWKLDKPEWLPLRPGEALPATARGRYIQIRADLYSDGSEKLTPSLSSITFRFEPDPPPPPPAKIVAIPHDGSVELKWTRVPVADLGGYLVYYGENPGEYFGSGAIEGESPVDAGPNLSLTLNGLTNGRLYFFAIASYDSPGVLVAGGKPAARAGSISAEVAARPLRTAP